MKIYIAGAHSTGKTSIARILAKEYKLPLLNEVARTVLAEKELGLESLRIDLDIVDDYQKEVFFRQLEEEDKYESFVSDRTFDNLAYAAQHSRVLASIINSERLKEYIEKLRKDDVYLFFIRPSKVTLKDDGVREKICWDGVVAIDAMIKFMFELFDLNYITINSNSMQERIKTIKTIIR